MVFHRLSRQRLRYEAWALLSRRTLPRAGWRVLCAVLLIVLAVPIHAHLPGFPPAAAAQTDLVRLYEKFELTLDWGMTYNNPFDPSEVSLDATFTAPDGTVLNVPGFYYQDYRRWVDNDYEEFEAVGDPSWKVRFSPTMLGTYTYVVNVTDSRGVNQVASGEFEAVASDQPGYVELGPLGRRTFQLSTGEPFVPVGLNGVSTWTSQSDIGLDFYYDRLPFFLENGMNTIRMQFTPNDMALIWTPGQFDYGVWRHYAGLDSYNMASAWKFDQITDMADGLGLKMLINIEQTLALGDFEGTESQAWVSSPFNVANGGMLNTPTEFFTDEAARQIVRDELRYIVARWGYSPSVFAWELFNEFDWLLYDDRYTEADIDAVLDWHAEMAEYLHEIDVNQHPVTTSVATPIHFWPQDGWYFDLWEIPDMDICNFHFYNLPLFNDDTVTNIVDYLNAFYAETTKPCIIGEWGLDATGAADEVDVAGIGMHNALWTATMMKTALLPHYYDEVHEFNQYPHFQALAKYLSAEPGMVDYDLAAVAVSDVQLEAFGLSKPDRALAWVHNKQSFNEPNVPAEVPGATLQIHGLVPGQYWIEFWDTYQGTVIDIQATIHDHEPMLIGLPPVSRDLAIKVWLQP